MQGGASRRVMMRRGGGSRRRSSAPRQLSRLVASDLSLRLGSFKNWRKANLKEKNNCLRLFSQKTEWKTKILQKPLRNFWAWKFFSGKFAVTALPLHQFQFSKTILIENCIPNKKVFYNFFCKTKRKGVILKTKDRVRSLGRHLWSAILEVFPYLHFSTFLIFCSYWHQRVN